MAEKIYLISLGLPNLKSKLDASLNRVIFQI